MSDVEILESRPCDSINGYWNRQAEYGFRQRVCELFDSHSTGRKNQRHVLHDIKFKLALFPDTQKLFARRTSVIMGKKGEVNLLKQINQPDASISQLYCSSFNPLNPELNPICYLLAVLGAHHFLHVSRIRVKLLTFRLLMSYIYGAPILDVSRSHTTTHHSR